MPLSYSIIFVICSMQQFIVPSFPRGSDPAFFFLYPGWLPGSYPPLGQRSGLERLGRLASSIVFFLCPVKRNSRPVKKPLGLWLRDEALREQIERSHRTCLRSKCGARASVYACIELPYADAQHSRSSEGKNSAVLSPAFLRLLRRI